MCVCGGGGGGGHGWGSKFNPYVGCITFMEIEHEIISMVILTLLLIQEGQLSPTVELTCTSTG